MSECKKFSYIARVSVLKIFEATSFEAIKRSQTIKLSVKVTSFCDNELQACTLLKTIASHMVPFMVEFLLFR